jgi:hypothetical protein
LAFTDMITTDNPSGVARDGESAPSDAVLALPLTDAERIDYQKTAERCGLSLVAWIRSRLNEAAKREAKEA